MSRMQKTSSAPRLTEREKSREMSSLPCVRRWKSTLIPLLRWLSALRKGSENVKEKSIVIDTVNKKYTADGKDIAPYLKKVEAVITPYHRELKLTYDRPELNIQGIMFCDDSIKKPIMCSCGNKISDYRFDCDCLCPKCKRHIIVSAGQILCDRFD